MRFVRVGLLAVALAAASGCAGGQRNTTLSYSDQAREAYDAAVRQMEDGSFLDATDSFQALRRKFGLSRFGWLAELRLADLDFKQERFAEAITSYRSWIRYHSTQPEVVYARYMIARCYFAQIPNDIFLAPAAWERDTSNMQDALHSLTRFVRDYESSEYGAEAKDYLRRTREMLARAEMSVAQYYLSRNRTDAAIARYRTVLDSYAGSGVEPEALLHIGEILVQTRKLPDAYVTFQLLIDQYPTSSFVESARRYLQFLGPSAAPTEPSATGQSSTSSATPGGK